MKSSVIADENSFVVSAMIQLLLKENKISVWNLTVNTFSLGSKIVVIFVVYILSYRAVENVSHIY